MERKLAAILVADVVGYTRLVSNDDIGTFQSLTACLEAVGQIVDAHRGHVFNVAGDSVVAVFPSAVEAVMAARSVLDELERRNAELSEERCLRFRIGISLGDVIEHQGTLLGDSVNVAARLEALSEPDTIFVSADVHRQVKNKLDLDFSLVGECQLKNIPDPVRVYRVGHPRGGPSETGATALATDPHRPPLAETAVPAMAILPLENLSGDPAQEYFCDGLTDAITTEMSKFRHLFVIAAHSAFTYKNKTVTAQQIGRELGVQYLLEGTVQRAEQKARINAQLIETQSSHHLWAESFQVEGPDTFAVQDEIIQRIVAVLALRIDAEERHRAMRRESPNPSAYDCYLRGMHLFSQESKERLDLAREMFERASRLDPGFARAFGYLAYTHVRSFILGWAGPEVLDTALGLAMKAVELDPGDYSNLWDLAFVHLTQGRVDQALAEYERAFGLNPNDADMLAEMAVASLYAGNTDKAISLIRRAMKINPYYPDWYRWNMGWARFNARQYDRAVEELTQIASPAKNVWLKLAASYARLGRGEDATAALERFLALEPDGHITTVAKRFPFKREADQRHWMESLRMAGLTD